MRLANYILQHIIHKYLLHRHLLEKHNAENLQDFGQTHFQFEFFLDNRYEYVHADRDPYLGLDRVDAGAKKRLDTQVLLDPFEEQFDLPAAFVKLGNGQCRQCKVVR